MNSGFVLQRVSARDPDFPALRAEVAALKDILEGRISTDAELLLELARFQAEDGSFRLTDSWEMPADARVDFGYYPTYLAAAIFMREYLRPEPRISPKTVEEVLARALQASLGRELRGHGYEAERGTIEALDAFRQGGLREFLERSPALAPRFQAAVGNILDEREAVLQEEGVYQGAWGADHTEEWRRLLGEIRPRRRKYAAYGSNMYAGQMKERCPGAKLLGPTYLPDFNLKFYRTATIEPRRGAKTPAVIWEIGQDDEVSLDRWEGYPKSYRKRSFVVTLQDAECAVMAYVMTEERKERDAGVKPRESYLDLIRQGYRDAGFTEEPFPAG